MKTIDFRYISTEECVSVQINGTNFCKNCKWTGISACGGKNIIKTGFNSKGYRVSENGVEVPKSEE